MRARDDPSGPTQRDMERQVGLLPCSAFSPVTLRVWWFMFGSLHLLCVAYFAAMDWHLPGTTLDMNLYYYGLGLGSNHDRTVAVVHGCIAVAHLCSLLWMIGRSIQKRTFVFPVCGLNSNKITVSRKRRGRNDTLASIYQRTVSSIGIFSLGSPYYDLVLMCREVVETALQTQQAYSMSLLLSRAQLTQGYVALLVLNCWSTVIVHFVFHADIAKRRFYALLIDCLLDLVTSVGISTALIVIYLPDFDFQLNDFPLDAWGVDAWLIRVLSEFQIMLVNTWGNLAARIVFAVSMLSNMNTMKKVLSAVTTRRSPVARRNNVSVLPLSSETNTGPLRTVLVVESRFTRALFFVWGVAVMILHLHAESIHTLPQCGMQVKPWFSTKASCSLLILDCYDAGISGTEREVTSQWQLFDLGTSVGLLIRHCSSFEMPSLFTKFSGLKMLKFYNSTITHWKESAALSNTYHPNLIMLYVARVNMTDGQLPRGLQGDDLPRTMIDIEFCVTNLRVLPDDFDKKWPTFSSIYFEASNLTEVPAPLVRLAPYDVSLAYNPIPSIPAELFEGNVAYLHIGGTLISELPQNVQNAFPIEQLRVDNTNVSFFWDWMDPIIDSADVILSDVPATIIASNTPYCNDIERICASQQTTFSAATHKGQSRILSDASMNNWANLRKAVSCEAGSPTMYTLEADDSSYAMHSQK